MKFEIGDIVKLSLEVKERGFDQNIGCICDFERGIGIRSTWRIDWLEAPFNGTSNLVYDDYIMLYDEAL